MLYLRTGLPGASKTLNSLKELVHSYNPYRPYYYHNIRLLILDIEVAKSFSGWYYGWYFPRLEDKALKNKLIKIMKPKHDEDEFLTIDDVPFLKSIYECHNHFETWIHWVRKVYPAKKLIQLETVLDCMNHIEEDLSTDDLFDLVRPLNLDFKHFDNPNFWFDLPKGSRILIDECQQFFPPRQAGSRAPEAIKKLETHRHGGYDIHFVTQDALLVDQNLRRLVGRHIHFFNPFGGKRVTRKENPETFNPKDYHQNKQATKKTISHPTEFYGVYYSAEIHTHSFKLPAKLWLLLILPLMSIGCMWYLYDSLFSQAFEDGAELDAPEAIQEEVETSYNERIKAPQNATQAVSTENQFLLDYVNAVTEDVYISGSMLYNNSRGVSYDYTFHRGMDGAVFHPSDVGLQLEPVNDCLVNIVVGDVRKPITCNPFYVRVPVESNDRNGRNSFDENEEGSGNLRLF